MSPAQPQLGVLSLLQRGLGKIKIQDPNVNTQHSNIEIIN